MVRPYLNKSDHEEYLRQFKQERNSRIRKRLLLFVLLAGIFVSASFFISFKGKSIPENFPDYLGGTGEVTPSVVKSSEAIQAMTSSEDLQMETSRNIADAHGIEGSSELMTKENNSTEENNPNEILLASSESLQNELGQSRGEDISQEIELKENNPTDKELLLSSKKEEKIAEAQISPERPSMKRNPELSRSVESPLFSAERMPKFPGGYAALKRYIKSQLIVPQEAKEQQVDGTVQVQFIVGSDGRLSNPRVAKGLGYGCDEVALSLVKKMPDWIPGKQDGEDVAVYYNLPIKFSAK
ncbi:MAG: TonB family protein [Bacteroidota bacterium]